MKILNLKDDPSALNILAKWHQQEWSHLNPGETIVQRINRMQDYLEDDFIPSTYIAKNNILLGSAAIVANDMTSRPELSPWLASVFVTPKQRNKGIGSQLIKHIMTQAKLADIKKLYLFTEDKKLFYKNLGWQTNSQETYHGQQVTILEANPHQD